MLNIKIINIYEIGKLFFTALVIITIPFIINSIAAILNMNLELMKKIMKRRKKHNKKLKMR